MGRRQRQWAKKARLRLIEELGGICVYCGAKTDLTIDHKEGINWDRHALDPSGRVCRYKQEAKQGLLQVACEPCNNKHHPERPDPDNEPF